MKKLPNFSFQPRIRFSAGLLLGLILAACFVLVSFSIKSYGASFDETSDYDYASANLRVYSDLVYGKPYDSLIYLYDLRYKGPAYWFVGEVAAWSVKRIIPGLDIFDGWHIVNFATFLVGAWCIFYLARRFVKPRAALLAALLYLTQPLLWGHGVMNAKDTPFMVFFLATVALGVKLVEELAKPSPPGRVLAFLSTRRRRIIAGCVALAVVLALADRIFGHFISLPSLTALLTQAYSPDSVPWLHALFLRIAVYAAAIPLNTYIAKLVQTVNLVEFSFLFLVLGGGGLYAFVRTSSRSRWLILAAIVGGMTISIRVLGQAAVGLVALYALLKLGRRALAPLTVYGSVSLLAAYAFWPFLWNAPIPHFIESLNAMSNFPWNGPVVLDGVEYSSRNLPWYYLPKLISIQLTLPLLVLSLVGVGLSIGGIVRRRMDWQLALIPLAWFWLPLLVVIVRRPNMYDNFRQFLFILPPLFLFAALPLEVGLGWLRAVPWRTAAGLAILLPGIVAGIWLHPYEYVYYNALVGWTGDVARQYETDYWFTAMCEAGRYVSAVAPQGASVALTDEAARTLFARCTDPAKKFQLLVERAEKSHINPQYSVIYTRYGDDKDYFRKMPLILTIQRGTAQFAVVKKAP